MLSVVKSYWLVGSNILAQQLLTDLLKDQWKTKSSGEVLPKKALAKDIIDLNFLSILNILFSVLTFVGLTLQ